MTMRTGKSGRYKYYTCATSQARGKTACPGRSVPMGKLDDAVTDALVQRLFEPSRLANMLRLIDEQRSRTSTDSHAEFVRIEADVADANARLGRLYDGVERGSLSLDDPDVTARIERVKTERAIAVAAKQRVLERTGPTLDLSVANIVALSKLMTDRIANGAVPFRKSYIRATVDSIVVGNGRAIVRGRKTVLRRRAGQVDQLTTMVPIGIQEWCARKDSNL